MTTTTPQYAFDCRDNAWWNTPKNRRDAITTWLTTAQMNPEDVYRIEIYTDGDAPLAKVYAYASDENGSLRIDDGELVRLEPVTLPADALLPHLEDATALLDLDALRTRIAVQTKVYDKEPLPTAAEVRQRAEDRDRLIEHDLPALVSEIERLRAQLDAPCGSCHPCTNWADETWRAAGRKPPHVHEWDEIREQHAALQDSADLLSRSYAAALDAIRDALASGDTAPIASFAAEAGLSITT